MRSAVEKLLSDAALNAGIAVILQADLVIRGNSFCCLHVRSVAWSYFTLVLPSWSSTTYILQLTKLQHRMNPRTCRSFAYPLSALLYSFYDMKILLRISTSAQPSTRNMGAMPVMQLKFIPLEVQHVWSWYGHYIKELKKAPRYFQRN
jgi:hypothetical protein